MALEKIPQFNRIIELTIIGKDKQEIRIPCPRHGRKPSIEINVTYAANNSLYAFNVTVKNLYLDFVNEQYASIKLKVGYADNLVDMEGSILSIYQESPGPEGRTVIQCQEGKMQQWLDAAVQLYYEPGTPIRDILEQIKTKVGAHQVSVGDKASNLKLPAAYEHDGSAREALTKLQDYFKDEKLYVFLRNDTLCAICIGEADYIASHKLEYTSAPVQPNAGSESGDAGYTTVTAPWIPQLSIGDKLEIPAKVYMRFLTTVNKKAGGTIFIQVFKITVHFGTTGGVNQMIVQGTNMKV